MDPSATALMHDIGAILDDFRADMGFNYFYGFSTDTAEISIQEVEEKTDNLIKEIKGLFNSSYSFNK